MEPSNFINEAELRRVGVVCTDHQPLTLACSKCGSHWSTTVSQNTGKPAPGYWRCPTGCNNHIRSLREPNALTKKCKNDNKRLLKKLHDFF